MTERGSRWLLRGTAVASLLAMLAIYTVFRPPNDVVSALPELVGRWLLVWTAVAAGVGIPLAGVLELHAWWRHRSAGSAASEGVT